MRIGRNGDTYFVALEPGESVRKELEAIAGKYGIKTGIIVHCIGAVKDLKLAFYELNPVDGDGKPLTGEDGKPIVGRYLPIDAADDGDTYEVASAQGNLTWKDGKPFLHMHLVASDRDGLAGGGHLVDATVAVALEVVIKTFREEQIVRRLDERVGLAVWTFPGYAEDKMKDDPT